jgi:hypothetical protein
VIGYVFVVISCLWCKIWVMVTDRRVSREYD